MFRAIRVSVLAIVLLLSVISLGLAAYLIHWSLKVISFSDDSDRFALVTSILSILVLLPMLVFALLRKQTVMSISSFEFAALSILWIFWLALGAHIASSGINHVNCSILSSLIDQYDIGGPLKDLGGLCSKVKALEALSFINWILLLLYTGVVAFFALTAHAKGIKPWRMHSDDLAARSYENPTSIPSPMTSPRAAHTTEDSKEHTGGSTYGQQLSYTHDV